MTGHPQIIQGGMGVGVSGWRLARAVARAGQLGVVSGTAVAVTLARRLWAGDPGGHLRGALGRFPDPGIAERILARYYRSAGGPAGFPTVPMFTVQPSRTLVELTVAAGFVEVALAKDGHDGPVGINLLEKIQLPTLPTLYGALLADVDYVFMGAGIPARIPAVLDDLAANRPASLPVTLTGDASTTTDEPTHTRFDPAAVFADPPPRLRRPFFAAIVSSVTLAKYLAGNTAGAPDGFVIEYPTAGGHNAPPRGRLQLTPDGQPTYGPRDDIDLTPIAALNRPFWLAGGQATPDALPRARKNGASGIQVGTAFAFCDESDLDPTLRQEILDDVLAGRTRVFTDPIASPTGYPFKTVAHPDTIADSTTYAARPRRCDLGYLREPYRRPDGHLGYRCAAEPVEDYLRKGGDPADTPGRHCLCNGLTATIGLGQTRPDGYHEPALVTAGDDLTGLTRFLSPGQTSYRARDVIAHLLDQTPAQPELSTPPNH
jgi:NAD(P)H-dependent flavin oxidoreductase YrpB (nitropropane dioxygenase family)